MLLCFIIQLLALWKRDSQAALTMSMTIFLNDCLCFFVKFWKMSQFSSCSSLKPTAKWWFSSTDESLYIKASSESAITIAGQNVTKACASTKSLKIFPIHYIHNKIYRWTSTNRVPVVHTVSKVTELMTEHLNKSRQSTLKKIKKTLCSEACTRAWSGKLEKAEGRYFSEYIFTSAWGLHGKYYMHKHTYTKTHSGVFSSHASFPSQLLKFHRSSQVAAIQHSDWEYTAAALLQVRQRALILVFKPCPSCS